jgi:hypothetical protein
MTTPHNSTEAEARGRHPYFDLFLISFLILFFELACIRWFGSMVVYLTFFTNIVLLATFLGMFVGVERPRQGDAGAPALIAGGVAGLRSLVDFQRQ